PAAQRPAGRPAQAPAPRVTRTPRLTGPVRAIGIGASTGGPQALAVLLTALPADFPIPLLIVQHMAVGFTPGLASWLARQTALPVQVGRPGQIAGPGAWFAPDEAHMTVGPNLKLGEDRRTGGRHRPSVDVLFSSMAASLGAGAVGVVLTGLGRDGADGVAAIVERGGSVMAQDEGSSVVYGMPRAAAEAGAQFVLAMDDIPGALRALKPAAAS
ncbi:MAG: CheB methylesterase domain-containing protein, partial [Solirubrobacteraceae bacterium]